MTEYCGSHMHGNENEKSCQCGCGCGCGFGSHHHHGEEGCHCTDKFLEIADEAWMEVLKEKIKAKIIAHKGEHMDKLAGIIAKANGERWKNKISAKTNGNEFKDSLKEFFSSCE